jgi:very-short-patch-repair endonuclease
MDFLLLLPRGRRVVLKVDGQHHYATGARPDPAVYAQTMRSDRELKLNDYDVFRFGAHELTTEQHARATAEEFFRDLFRTAGVSIM